MKRRELRVDVRGIEEKVGEKGEMHLFKLVDT